MMSIPISEAPMGRGWAGIHQSCRLRPFHEDWRLDLFRNTDTSVYARFACFKCTFQSTTFSPNLLCSTFLYESSRLPQPQKAPVPMLNTLDRTTIEVRLKQAQNASMPMRVTLSGMFIDARFESSKALSQMTFVPSLIT